jgi:hypothetical protein
MGYPLLAPALLVVVRAARQSGRRLKAQAHQEAQREAHQQTQREV